MREATPESADVFLVSVLDPISKLWDHVAAPDYASRVAHIVRVYQERYRDTRRRIRVMREPRRTGTPVTDCGYCQRPHWGRCVTDGQANPVPIGKEREFAEDIATSEREG